EQGSGLRLGIAAQQPVALATRAEQLVRVAAETRGHAIDRLTRTDPTGKEIRRPPHLRELRRIERDPRPMPRNRDDLRAGQVGAVEGDDGVGHRMVSFVPSPGVCAESSKWIPAFAGMTMREVRCGNDDV